MLVLVLVLVRHPHRHRQTTHSTLHYHTLLPPYHISYLDLIKSSRHVFAWHCLKRWRKLLTWSKYNLLEAFDASLCASATNFANFIRFLSLVFPLGFLSLTYPCPLVLVTSPSGSGSKPPMPVGLETDVVSNSEAPIEISPSRSRVLTVEHPEPESTQASPVAVRHSSQLS